MRRIKSILTQKWTSPAIQILSLLLAVLAFCYAIRSNNRTEELQVQLRAFQIQPRLTLYKPPYIKAVAAKSEKFAVKSLLAQIHQVDSSGIHNVPLLMRLHVTCQLFVKNTGNALAKNFGTVQADTLSWVPFLRESLHRSIASHDTIRITEIEQLTELLPGDTTVLTFDNDVTCVNSGYFTLHFLLLYENELGNLYDSYIWAPFRAKPFTMEAEVLSVDTQQYVRVIPPKLKAQEMIIPAGPVNSAYWTYDEKEGSEIGEYLQSQLSRKEK